MSQEKIVKCGELWNQRYVADIHKSKMLIYQPKDISDEIIRLVKSLIVKTQKLEKIKVRGLYGDRELHVSFWSTI